MVSKTIFEVRRILLEHLREIDADDRVAQQAERIAQREETTPAEPQPQDTRLMAPVVIER